MWEFGFVFGLILFSSHICSQQESWVWCKLFFTAGNVSLHPSSFRILFGVSGVNCHMVSVLQDAVSALLARTSAELLAVEQELAQEEAEEEEEEPRPEQRGPGEDW